MNYEVSVIYDIAGHSVFYDGFGPGVPLRIRSDLVRRHIRTDTGECIRTDTIGTIEIDDATIKTWPEFAPFEGKLKAYLAAQIAAMTQPA